MQIVLIALVVEVMMRDKRESRSVIKKNCVVVEIVNVARRIVGEEDRHLLARVILLVPQIRLPARQVSRVRRPRRAQDLDQSLVASALIQCLARYLLFTQEINVEAVKSARNHVVARQFAGTSREAAHARHPEEEKDLQSVDHVVTRALDRRQEETDARDHRQEIQDAILDLLQEDRMRDHLLEEDIPDHLLLDVLLLNKPQDAPLPTRMQKEMIAI